MTGYFLNSSLSQTQSEKTFVQIVVGSTTLIIHTGPGHQRYVASVTQQITFTDGYNSKQKRDIFSSARYNTI